MTKTAGLILMAIFYMIITSAFQCGRPPIIENCTEYIQDTVTMPFVIANNNAPIHIYDTINIKSIVSDSIHSVKGKNFLYPFNTLNSSFQAYKVVNSGSGFALNYANIEFNPIVTEGEILQIPNQGININYSRLRWSPGCRVCTWFPCT